MQCLKIMEIEKKGEKEQIYKIRKYKRVWKILLSLQSLVRLYPRKLTEGNYVGNSLTDGRFLGSNVERLKATARDRIRLSYRNKTVKE